MTLKEIIASKIARQQELKNTAEAETRDLNEEETREFEELQRGIDILNEALGQTEGQPEPAAEGMRSNEETVEIIAMCRHFDISPEEFIRSDMGIDQIRSAIMTEQMKKAKPVTPKVTYGDSEEDKRRRAIVDGVILRGGGNVEKPAAGANGYRGFSLRDIAIECLERDGVSGDLRHMDTNELFGEATRGFYTPKSSFPAILDEVVQKSYTEGQQQAGTQFDRFVKIGSLPNFKKSANHEYLISYSGELDEVPENGELKNYIPEDVRLPLRELKTYGRQFTLTRQAFIDDDIGMLTTVPRRIAKLSKTTQNKIVYSILLNKQKIFDGQYMFHASRKNTLSDGTAPTLEAIQKMIFMIGIQKDEAGNQLALTPNCFIVPLGLGAEVKKHILTPTIYSAEGTITNPLYGQEIEVIEDVSLNLMSENGKAVPWYMGVKGEFIQVDYLNGQRDATIRRSEVAGKLGFVWDCWHDFGVSALHPNAICRNPGVTISDEGVIGS